MPETSLPAVASGDLPGCHTGDPSPGHPANIDGGTEDGGTADGGTTDDAGGSIAGPDLLRLSVSLLARAVLFAVLGLLVWAVLPVPLGWQPTTVVTGSMVPRIYAGDVILARPIPTGTAALGQILLVDDPDHAGRLRLHRYVDNAPDGGLILRGDANFANDSSPVTPEAVHGVAVLRVPFVGLPVVWFTERNWGNLAAVFVAAAALLAAAASAPNLPASPSPGDSIKPGSTPDRPGARGNTSARRPGNRRRSIPRTRSSTRRNARLTGSALLVAAVSVLATPLMSPPAHARFSAAAPTAASSFSSLASYPCPVLAAPPDSPAFFYRFDESSGLTAEDASANQRNGVLSRAGLREPGSCRTFPSPALKLGGSPAGYVSTGTAPVTAPDTFSVEIWFKTAPGSASAGRLIGFGNSRTGDSTVSDRHLYLTSTGALAFGAAPNPGNSQNYKSTAITSDARYNDGNWHQATATMSAAGMKLYVDGMLVNENNVRSGADISGYWRIGYDALDSNNWPGVSGSPVFTGTVDNAAVYPAALTAGQVAAHFNATKTQIRGY